MNKALPAAGPTPDAGACVDSPLEFDALRRLALEPALTQRQLSAALGSSLGRTNFIVQALLKKGLVKMRRFRNSDNKWGYTYLLTPDGWATKALMTKQFLRMKLDEYESLRAEIETLRSETLRSETQASGPADE